MAGGCGCGCGCAGAAEVRPGQAGRGVEARPGEAPESGARDQEQLRLAVEPQTRGAGREKHWYQRPRRFSDSWRVAGLISRARAFLTLAVTASAPLRRRDLSVLVSRTSPPRGSRKLAPRDRRALARAQTGWAGVLAAFRAMAAPRSALSHSHISFPKHSAFQTLTESAIGGPRPLGGASLRRLSKPTALFIAVAWGSAVLLTFSLLLWQSATFSYNQQVLSLNQDVAGSFCEEVPLPITGTFEGDLDGFWQTHPAFRANRSAFVLEVTGAELTHSQYQRSMQKFAVELKELNSKFQNTNVLLNNLAWATYSFKEGPLVFRSNSDLNIMFNMQVAASSLASMNGICGYQTAAGGDSGPFPAKYDKALSRLVLRFPASLVTNTTDNSLVPLQYCPGQGNWIAVSNNKGLSPRAAQFAGLTADFSFDIQSTVLVLSLNLGIAKTTNLLEVRSRASEANGLIGYVQPGRTMDPIYCLNKDTALRIYKIQLTQAQLDGPPVCFLIESFYSRTLYMFYPWINQVAYDNSKKLFSNENVQRGCTCPRDQKDLGCNIMERLFVSYFYDLEFMQKRTIEFGIRLLDIFLEAGSEKGGMALINSLTNLVVYSAYVANSLRVERIVSFTDSKSGIFYDNSWANNLTLIQLSSREFEKICPTCGAILFQVTRFLARSDFSFPINRNGLSVFELVPPQTQSDYITVSKGTSREFDLPPTQAALLNGTNYPYVACQDTLTQSAAIAGLTRQPPVKLINSYYSCRKSWQTAISSAIGASAAATNLYILLAWVLFGLLYKKVYPLIYGEFYPTESRLERVSEAEREIERFTLVEVVESLAAIADEIRDKESSSAVSAAIGLRSKISNYTRLFKRGEDGTEVEELRRQQLGALITGKLCNDVEQPASFESSSPKSTRRFTRSLLSANLELAAAESSDVSSPPLATLTLNPLDMVLSSTRPPERLSIIGGGESRRSASTRASFVGPGATGVHTL